MTDRQRKNFGRGQKKERMKRKGRSTKKEKQQHIQFLNREEIKFWKQFPRNTKFYHKALGEIKRILETPMRVQDGGMDQKSTPTHSTR